MSRSKLPTWSRLAVMLMLAANIGSVTPEWSQSETFYKGKTLRIEVGSATADFYAGKNAEIAKEGFGIFSLGCKMANNVWLPKLALLHRGGSHFLFVI